ncbi:Spo0B domain-containing protein [Alicyclobacillus pomorum]|uniref:Spo0B domain-containing protein n=1 Tax=Alicyclobacillus pomorum TaxID=204470 RepID=UPI0003FB5B0C|nr:Spo0B domain-containing protein [Alicyclobacillus pomorum]
MYEFTLDASEAFRRHRHDVMNSLQLVKAYIQMEKSDKALQAVNDLADWLKSLSLVQMRSTEPQLLWTAAQCPRVRFAHVPEDVILRQGESAEICRLLEKLESLAAQYGQALVKLSIASPVDRCHLPLHITISLREELRDLWNNVQSEPWSYLLLDVQWSTA